MFDSGYSLFLRRVLNYRPRKEEETEAMVPIIERDTKKLWLAAIKPPMYTVAVIPIWVSASIASFANPTNCYLFLISAILIIAWLNSSNDAFDADTGVDKNKASSLVNITGNKNLVLIAANILLILGISGIALIGYRQQDLAVITLSTIAIALGYAYQGPPFRWSYLGLGEPISIVTFGPLFGSAVYWSQTKSWSWENLAASLIVGIATSLILFCSHFHQIDDDRLAGKKSPIVRLGTQKAAQLLPYYAGSIYLLTVAFIILKIFPIPTLAIFGSLPVAIALIRQVKEYHDVPEKIANCKFLAVRWHFTLGLLLGLAYVSQLLPF